MFGKKNETFLNIDHTALTLIGEHCTIEGNITSKTSLKIEGTVLGHLNIEGQVILSDKSRVTGDIHGAEVTVYGNIEGNIHAKSVQLKSSARITGNINTASLQIDPGAIYHGNVTMQQQAE